MPTVAETQLQIYNDALLLCEERILSSVTEPRKPRYLLDEVWNGGGINACLEESDWDFARRTTSLTYDPNIQPGFGYLYAYAHPPDWLRTSALNSDPYFEASFTEYSDEAGYWFSDLQTIFVKYVSNDPAYGMNLNNWTEAFKQFVAAHFAAKIVGSLTHDKDVKDKVYKLRQGMLDTSRSKDAMNEPPGFMPRGNWSRARNGSYMGRPGWTGGGSGRY